jgi:hypothetical protein
VHALRECVFRKRENNDGECKRKRERGGACVARPCYSTDGTCSFFNLTWMTHLIFAHATPRVSHCIAFANCLKIAKKKKKKKKKTTQKCVSASVFVPQFHHGLPQVEGRVCGRRVKNVQQKKERKRSSLRNIPSQPFNIRQTE